MSQAADIAIPILPSRSLEMTLKFFSRLGFEGEIHPHGAYAILRRGTVELHFFHHPAVVPEESASMCYIRVQNAVGFYKALERAGLPGRGIPRMDELEAKPWGMREFAVVDEDGNLLRIGEVMEE